MNGADRASAVHIAWLKHAKLTKADLAKQMDTSRSAENPSLTLGSLAKKVAAALGKRVHVELVDDAPGHVARRRARRHAA